MLVPLSLAGATLGFLHLRTHWDGLTGTSVDVRPTVSMNGQLGVMARVRF